MSSVNMRPDELFVLDADKAIVRECDDVVLLRQEPSTGAGNVAVEMVREGTSGTVISIGENGSIDVECYVGPEQFAFASPSPEQIRIFRRREEKLSHAAN